MQKGYKLIKKVLDKFPGLPRRLTSLFGKSDTWWRSHGYELKQDNPLSNGNLSAIDHFFTFVDRYEAANPGAGKMLAEEIAAELRARYCAQAEMPCDREIRRTLYKEFYEAMQELDKCDLKDKTELELAATDGELSHIETEIGYARAHVRAALIKRKAGNIVSGVFGAHN